MLVNNVLNVFKLLNKIFRNTFKNTSFMSKTDFNSRITKYLFEAYYLKMHALFSVFARVQWPWWIWQENGIFFVKPSFLINTTINSCLIVTMLGKGDDSLKQNSVITKEMSFQFSYWIFLIHCRQTNNLAIMVTYTY